MSLAATLGLRRTSSLWEVQGQTRPGVPAARVLEGSTNQIFSEF